MLTSKDEETGYRITPKQLELLLLLNPVQENPPTYREIAKKLGVSYMACVMRMYNFKKRCPAIHRRFKELQRSMKRARNSLWKPQYIEEMVDIQLELGFLNRNGRQQSKDHRPSRVRKVF